MLASAHLVQHGDHGNVGLASASGRADQQVLVAVEGGGEDAALNAVQLPAGTKRRLYSPVMNPVGAAWMRLG